MRRDPALLSLLSLGIRALWATQVPVPRDWDPAYYAEVAGHIARGEGPITQAIWGLSALPAALPYPADLHWMPLPSRILVPLVALSPAHGAQLSTLLLAAAWAPLAWALTRRLAPDDPQAARIAGLFAALGGGYGAFLSTPDSIALFGLLGGLATLALLDRRDMALAACAVALTLCRGDGLLLAAALGLGLRAKALRVWLPALLAYAAWALRNHLADPALAAASRAAAALSPNLGALVRGEALAIDLPGRIAATLAALPSTLATALVLSAGLLLPLALVGAALHRRQPAVQVGLAYAVGLPLLAIPLAPAIAASGTVMRSGAALFPLTCALAALGLARLNHLAITRRDLHPAFLPATVLLAVALAGLSLGQGALRAVPAPQLDCALLADLPAGEPIFAAEPLLVAARCDRPAVVLPAGADPAHIAAVIDRYQLRHALLPAAVAPGTLGATAAAAATLLPGWTCDPQGRCAAP